jgi:membrane protein YdbS with pleckstrin-like domain
MEQSPAGLAVPHHLTEHHAGVRPPSETLDPRTRTVWRLTSLCWVVPLLVVSVVGAAVLVRWGTPVWAGVLLVLAVAVPGAVDLAVAPGLRFRHWRYEVTEEEIDLQHGMLTITRTLIPMARIQHADTRRGLLQRRFGLSSLVIFTAAGASTIPGLAAATAEALRTRIAALARTRDDL